MRASRVGVLVRISFTLQTYLSKRNVCVCFYIYINIYEGFRSGVN